MDPKPQFIAASLRDRLAVTELCALYGISRTTGYPGIARDLTHGPQGLEARSRRPSTSPRHTPGPVVAASADARRRHPSWGAKELLSSLYTRHARWPWPARSTAWDILRRHGLAPKKRQRRLMGPPGNPTSHSDAPRDVWSADFKGHCKTGDGRYGDPLPIPAGHSRFLRSCPALASTSGAEAQPGCTRVFKACGRPRRLRTAHGVPCAPTTLARLSQWPACGVRLGLWPELIEPGKPAQTGRHERRPRPLQADTTRPPGATRRAQPQQCTHFRQEVNQARPHEALGLRTPAVCYEPSPRHMPHPLPPLDYPGRFEGRDVSANGGIRWNSPWGNVSITCAGD